MASEGNLFDLEDLAEVLVEIGCADFRDIGAKPLYRLDERLRRWRWEAPAGKSFLMSVPRVTQSSHAPRSRNQPESVGTEHDWVLSASATESKIGRNIPSSGKSEARTGIVLNASTVRRFMSRKCPSARATRVAVRLTRSWFE